jgi:alkylresorcinol/alkylpyrone synthase
MTVDPRLLSLATAVPAYPVRQADIRERMRRLFVSADRAMERLMPAFDNAGIETRYSCVPLDWYDEPHGWVEKNELYLANALDLLETAARQCLDDACLTADAVDAVVCVSTSGIATPSLEARLMDRLGLRSDVMRLPVFGLGCAGGVLGLARAADLVRADPTRRVLCLVVELCGLTFRAGDRTKGNVIATALFGDGCAAALLGGEGDGPALTGWGEYTWPDTLDIMGWRVEEDGLGVLFSRDIPAFVRREMRTAADHFLAAQGLDIASIDNFVCHPGGAKVVSALEDVYGLQTGGLDDARTVLRDFGNMSAATVLFVLKRFLDRGGRGRALVSTLGPGFTAGFMTLETA